MRFLICSLIFSTTVLASGFKEPIEPCQKARRFRAPQFVMERYYGWRMDVAFNHYLNTELTQALEKFVNDEVAILPCADFQSEDK